MQCNSPNTFHLKELISEEEFLGKIRKKARDFIKLYLFVLDNKENDAIFNGCVYFNILMLSRSLEDFLDDYEAKNNKTWHHFRELVASIRGFSFILHLYEHIKKRYLEIEKEEKEEEEVYKVFKEFLNHTEAPERFFRNALLWAFEEIKEESIKLKINMPKEKFHDIDFLMDVASNKILPHNIDGIFMNQETKYITNICSNFINIGKKFNGLGFDYNNDDIQINETEPYIISEAEIRVFELQMHNLQSIYDTFVKDSVEESKDARLPIFRAYISILLHLFEICRIQIHFYERHKQINELLRKAIPDQDIRIYIIKSIHFLGKILEPGSILASELLGHYSETDSIKLPIPALGFHMRPSSLVVSLVKYYGSEVFMKVGNRKFNAGNLLELMWAGGEISRENIKEVIFEGDKRVLHDLELLAKANYGEDIIGTDKPLPRELEYLRDRRK
ncbi:MAG: HPr family phosphocarrier protein [bacterium]